MIGIEWEDPRKHLERAFLYSPRDPSEIDTIVQPRRGSRKAQILADMEAYSVAETIYLQALETSNRDAEKDYMALLLHKAMIHRSLDDIPGTLAVYDRIVEFVNDRLPDTDHPAYADNLATAYMNKGIILCEVRRFDEAMPLFQAAESVWWELVSKHNMTLFKFSLGLVSLNQALTLGKLDRNREMMNAYDRAIDILEELVESGVKPSPEHELALCYFNKAAGLFAAAEGDQRYVALNLTRRAVRIWERLIQVEAVKHPRYYLASAWIQIGDIRHALYPHLPVPEEYQRGIEIMTGLVRDEGRTDLANILANAHKQAATAYGNAGHSRTALKHMNEAVTILDRLTGIDGREDVRTPLIEALEKRGGDADTGRDGNERGKRILTGGET